MSQISDKKIIEWINNKNYSKLTFLEECWLSSENEWYLGFYYFMQDFKQENKQDTFSAIVSRFDGMSSAYCYLGNTAEEMFDSHHISASFFRKSIELNEENSEAHWGLYYASRDMVSCLKSLKLDYENGHFNKLKNKINSIYPNPNTMSGLSREDWLLIKKILLDVRVCCRQNMLISAHFYLSEFDEGIVLIDAIDKVNVEIVRPYFDQALISKDKVLSKLHDYQVSKFLNGDHKSIYHECVKEFKKGNPNPTRAVLIERAFRAEAFQDVVTHYDEAPLDNVLLLHDLDSRLYYLLAQSYLNQKPNKKVLDYVSEKTASLEGKSSALNQACKFKNKTEKLEKLFAEGNNFDVKVDFMGIYQEAVKILDNRELLKHFLYEQLDTELKSLKAKWNNSYYRKQLTEMKGKLSSGDMGNDDFLRLYNLGIECSEYDYVIDSVTEFHNDNPPTMSSYNCIGVCYERKEELNNAFEHYKLALSLMRSSKDYNHVIIGNYISCAEKLPNIDIPQDEFDELRDLYNADLVNQFKWHTFTAKRWNRLFKYSPFNINAIDSLTNQYFYLASKEQLNDPIELPTLNKVGSDHLIDSNYRICSFSNNNDSMLMWSHYAQEHQGIMVEYWFGGEFPNGFGVEKVSYTNEFKRNKEKDSYIFNQYILTKNEEWSYEDEVRLFSNRSEKVSFEIFDYPNNDRSKINARVCSITLGYKFPDHKKQLIANIVKLINSSRMNHEPQVTLSEAYISDDNRFALKYREIGIL